MRLTSSNGVFSECTEAVATSLITNFPDICAFIICFSFAVWTKMRPLAGSLKLKEGKGSTKKNTDTSNRMLTNVSIGRYLRTFGTLTTYTILFSLIIC